MLRDGFLLKNEGTGYLIPLFFYLKGVVRMVYRASYKVAALHYHNARSKSICEFSVNFGLKKEILSMISGNNHYQ